MGAMLQFKHKIMLVSMNQIIALYDIKAYFSLRVVVHDFDLIAWTNKRSNRYASESEIQDIYILPNC